MDDLERFWANIFSEDAALIGEAWATLSAGEREAIAGHLRSIVTDSDRLPEQRRAARVALSAVLQAPVSPTDKHSSVASREGTQGTPPLPSHAVLVREGWSGGKVEVWLASGSPRRRELIALLGLPYGTTPADVDETPHPGEAPAAMVLRLSRAKAESARATTRPSDYQTTRPFLLSADTTVSLEGEILAKPADAGEARSMLTRLRGRSHQVYTAIALIDLETGEQITDLATTEVPMRNYSDAEMEAYIATGDSLDKAGGYAIQHGRFNPVAKMSGCYANVVGLPLCHVARSLRALGVKPPADVPAACQAHLGYECPVFRSILTDVPASERSKVTMTNV